MTTSPSTSSGSGQRPNPAFDTLLAAARSLRGVLNGRVLLGVAGPPGAGKSTLSAAFKQAMPGEVAVVGMDAFHLDDAELRRLDRLQRKGAPDTFDVEAYVELLRLIRMHPDTVVRAPVFDRRAEASVPDATQVGPEHWLVITEGNYLLLDGPDGWNRVRHELDAVWYVDVEPVERRERLVARRVHHGDTPDEARAWVLGVDEPNAQVVELTRGRADGCVTLDADGSPRLDWLDQTRTHEGSRP